MQVTRQLLSELCLGGMALDALGGCYLAYDLFGGMHGPLRAVARTAGYMALFFLGYALVLGMMYALVASLGMGVLLGIEYRLAGDDDPDRKPGRIGVFCFAMLRGVALGLASTTLASVKFGICFGLLSGLLLGVTYLLGFAPTHDYSSKAKPSVNLHKFVASILRTVGVGVAGIATGYLTRVPEKISWVFGLRLGLAAGVVSAIVGLLSPWVEWQIDRMENRRLGIFGLGLILIGMALQSVQYWVVVFNLSVS